MVAAFAKHFPIIANVTTEWLPIPHSKIAPDHMDPMLYILSHIMAYM